MSQVQNKLASFQKALDAAMAPLQDGEGRESFWWGIAGINKTLQKKRYQLPACLHELLATMVGFDELAIFRA